MASEPELPDCGRCGKPLTVLEWIDVTTIGQAEQQLLPGVTKCDNPECPDRNWHKAEDRDWLKRQMQLVEDR